MSASQKSKTRKLGSAWERIWEGLTGSPRRSVKDRKPRRLMVDPLEARMLLSVSPVNVTNMQINQSLINYLSATTTQSGPQNTTSNTYANMSAGKAVAMDNNGDFVVTWAQNDGQSGTNPTTGYALTDNNIYARYFTQAVQRITLPVDAQGNLLIAKNPGDPGLPVDPTNHNLPYFSLVYNGNEVQTLTFSAGVQPFTGTPAGATITGTFQLSYNGVTLTDPTTGSSNISFNEADPVGSAANIQTMLRDAGVGSNIPELTDVTVTATDADNYAISFGPNSAYLGGSLGVLNPTNVSLAGFLPNIAVAVTRMPETTAKIYVSPTSAATTAANIQYAFQINYQQVEEGQVFMPGADYINNANTTKIVITGPTTLANTAMPSISAVSHNGSATQFDITFTGNYGYNEQPLMSVVKRNEIATNDPTNLVVGATVTMIKQSSDAFRVNAPELQDPASLASTIFDQTDPQVAMDAAGDFTITWQSTVPNPTNGSDIFARRFSPAGEINSTMTNADGTTVTDVNGNAIIFNEIQDIQITPDPTSTTGLAGTFQLITGRGETAPITIAGNDPTSLAQAAADLQAELIGDLGYDPSTTVIVKNSAGPYVFEVGFGGYDTGTSIPLVQVDPSTQTLGANVTFAVTSQTPFVADMNHDGLPDTPIQGVRALGSQFQVNTIDVNPVTNPSIGMDGAGDFTIAWQDQGPNFSFGNVIKAQRYDSNGNPIGTEFLVNANDDTSFNYNAHVEMSHDGQFTAIGWTNSNTAAAWLFNSTTTVAGNANIYSPTGAMTTVGVGGQVDGFAFDYADNLVETFEYASDADGLGAALNSNGVRAEEWSVTLTAATAAAPATVTATVIRPEFAVNSSSLTGGGGTTWPGYQGNAQPAISANGDLTVAYEGVGPDMSEFVDTTNLLDTDSYINLQLATDQQNGATPSQLAQDRAALEAYYGLARGANYGPMFSQYDAAVGPTGNYAPSNVLNSDSDPSALRQGQNTSYLIALDPNATAGNFSLSVLGAYGGKAANVTVNVVYNNNVLNAASTVKAIHDAIAGAASLGNNWPLRQNGTSYAGTVSVRLLSAAEVTTITGTAWDPTNYWSTAPGVSPATGQPYIYEITFLGEQHDAYVTLGAPSGGTAYNTMLLPNPGNLNPAPLAILPAPLLETYGNAGNAYEFPTMTAPSIAMTASGNFVEVWNQPTLTNDWADLNTSLEYRMFQESTDPVGPSITGVLTPDPTTPGNQLSLNNGDTVRQPLSYITVSFDENMMTTGAGSVTNPANWALMENGNLVTGGISKIYYGMNEAADNPLFGGVASNRYEAVLVLNGGGNSPTGSSFLLNGNYQIIAKNSLRNADGNILGYSGYTPNGIAGGAFSLSFNVDLPTGTETRVNADPLGGQVSSPPNGQATASDADGNYVVAWAANQGQNLAFTLQPDPTSGVIAGGYFALTLAPSSSQGAVTSADILFNPNNLTQTAADMQSALSAIEAGTTVVYDAVTSNPAQGLFSFDVSFAASSPSWTQPPITLQEPGTVANTPTLVDNGALLTATNGPAAGVYAKLYDANWTTNTAVPAGRTSNPTVQPVINPATGLEWLNDEIVVTSNPSATDVSVAHNAGGDFVVTWAQLDAGNAWNVYAQCYNASGVATTAAFLVNSTIVKVHRHPVVAMDAQGDFTIAWQSLNQDGSGYGIYDQRYSSTGLPLGGSDAVQVLNFVGLANIATPAQFSLHWDNGTGAALTDTSQLPGNPTITYTPLTVNTTAQTIATQLDQLIASELNVPVGTFVNVTVVSGTQIAIEFMGAVGDQSVAQLAVNNLTIVGGAPGATITAATTVNGNSGETLVNTTTAGDQIDPAIAMNAAGAYVISWTSYGQDGDLPYESNIYAKSFQSSESLALQSHRTTQSAEYDFQPASPIEQANKVVTTDATANHVVNPGTGYDGIVEIIVTDANGQSYLGSGVLLSDGKHILTAAHVVYDTSIDQPVSGASVTFNLSTGPVTMTATAITINPGYDPNNLGVNDIAVITLPQAAPAGVTGYALYTGSSELGQVMNIYGYGMTGTGATGTTANPNGSLYHGENTYDVLGDVLLGQTYASMGIGGAGDFVMPAGSTLMYDFDDGTAAHDAIGLLFGVNNLGLGTAEATSTHGDSGGPILINGQIVGLTDFGFSPPNIAINANNPNISSQFGSISVDERISYFASWIDSVTAPGGGGGAETLVNTVVAGIDNFSQKWSSVAIDNSGDFVVTWTSYGEDGQGTFSSNPNTNGGNGIYAQRFNSTGAKVDGNEFQVNTFTPGNQQYSRVAMDAAGDFTVVWESFQDRPTPSFNGPNTGPDSPTSYGIYGQRYVANSLVGKAANTNLVTGAFENEFAVNTTKDGDQRYPSIAMDSNGDFLVVWSGNGVSANGQTDPQGIFMQRFDRPTKTVGATVIATYDVDQSPENPTPPTPAGPANVILVPNGGTLTTPPNVETFLVTFSEQLSTNGGTFGANSVTNPNNWGLLLNNKAISGGIMSVQFGLSEAHVIDPTIPADGKWEAVVQFDSDPNTAGQQPLGVGNYVLTINPAIQDMFGVAIDGQGLGTPGNGFSRTFVVASVGGGGGGGSGGGGSGGGSGGGAPTDELVNTEQLGTQDHPAVASDAAGDYVVVWESIGEDGDAAGDGNIWAQEFNIAGQPKGAQILVNTVTAGSQIAPAVAMDSFGNFVVAWSGAGAPGDDQSGVYAQAFDSLGNKVGAQFRVNQYTTSTQNQPSVAMDAAGDVIITWSSYGEAPNTNGEGIWARRFNRTGAPESNEFLVNTNTTGNHEYSDVAMDAHGDFTVVWQSYAQDGSSWGIYGQRFNAADTKVGGEFQVNTVATNAQELPKIAMDANGDSVVTWESLLQDGSGWGIYARRYNSFNSASSTPTGAFLDASDVQVNQHTAGDQVTPDVAMDGSGNYIITWSTFGQDTIGNPPNLSDYGVFARKFHADGSAYIDPKTLAPLGEFQVNNVALGNSMVGTQVTPVVAMDAAGDHAFAWVGPDDLTDTVPSVGIYTGAYLASSALKSAALGPTISNVVVSLAGASSVITWTTADSAGIGAVRLVVDGNNVSLIYGPYATSTKSTYNFSGVIGTQAVGNHSYVIQVTDASANQSYTNYTGSFTVVGNTGPTISNVVVQLTGTQPVITWSAADPAGLGAAKLTLDGKAVTTIYGPYGTKTNANYSGVLGTLASGSHTYMIQMTDTASKPVTSSYSGSFTVGNNKSTNAPPTITNAAVSATNPPVITWTAADSAGVASTTVQVDGKNFTTLTAPTTGTKQNGNYSVTLGTLAAGTHTYSIVATDANATPLSTTYSGSFTVAATPPPVTNTPPTITNVAMSPATTQSVITWMATDSDGIAKVSLTVDGKNISTIYGPYSTSTANAWNYSGVTGALAVGNHAFVIQVTDANAKPASTSYSGTLTVPAANAPPTITNAAVSATNPPVITWTAADSAGIASTTVQVDGQTFTTLTAPTSGTKQNGNYSVTLGTLAAGNHTYSIVATDANASPLSTTYSGSFTVAATPPPVTNTPPTITNVATSPATTQSVVTWHAADTDGIAKVSLTVDGKNISTIYGPYGTKYSGDYSGVTGALAVGNHTFVIQVTDANATPASTSYTGNFTVPSPTPQGPTIAGVVITENNGNGDGIIQANEGILVTWTANDQYGISSTTAVIDGVAAKAIYGPYTGNAYAAVFNPQTAGSHTVTIKAADNSSAHTSSQYTQTISVAQAVAAALAQSSVSASAKQDWLINTDSLVTPSTTNSNNSNSAVDAVYAAS